MVLHSQQNAKGEEEREETCYFVGMRKKFLPLFVQHKHLDVVEPWEVPQLPSPLRNHTWGAWGIASPGEMRVRFVSHFSVWNHSLVLGRVGHPAILPEVF